MATLNRFEKNANIAILVMFLSNYIIIFLKWLFKEEKGTLIGYSMAIMVFIIGNALFILFMKFIAVNKMSPKRSSEDKKICIILIYLVYDITFQIATSIIDNLPFELFSTLLCIPYIISIPIVYCIAKHYRNIKINDL